MLSNFRGIFLLWNRLDAPEKKEKQNVLRGNVVAMYPHVAILILLTEGSADESIHVIIGLGRFNNIKKFASASLEVGKFINLLCQVIEFDQILSSLY